MNIPLRLFALAACLAAVVSAAAPAARPFKETVLPSLPGGWMADVKTLNDLGDVGGGSIGTDSGSHAVIWPHGTTQPKTLPELPGAIGSFVTRLNNHGEAVGTSIASDSTHGVMWDRAGVHTLPPLPGQADVQVFGLNNRGQAVGSSGSHATLWDARGPHDLGIPSGAVASDARAINERGDILLVAYIDDGSPFGITKHYVLRHGKLLPTNLPVDRHFIVTGLSNNGTVVGNLVLVETRTFQAWTSLGGKAHPLPPLPGDDSDGFVVISPNGKTAGRSGTDGASLVAWDARGVKSLESRLPVNGVAAVGTPVAMNIRGQILCAGYDGENNVGVLLTP